MEIFVTNVKEIVVCKNNKKSRFLHKNQCVDRSENLTKGFFYNYE